MNVPNEKTCPAADVVLRSGKQIIAEKHLPADLIKIAKQVFNHPQDWPDGIFRSPLAAVADFLLANGVTRPNLRAGLLTYLSLNSVTLGSPMSIVLRAEEIAVASHMLMICKLIAPGNSFLEVRDLKPEQLYASPDFFRNKVLICEEVVSIKKALPDLFSLITQGRAARQGEFKSKFGSGIQDFTAKYKVAFIGVENSDAESIINHPAVIKVPVQGSDHTQIYSESDQFLKLENYSGRIGGRCIATQFERLAPRRVSIPYFDRVVRGVMDARPAHLKMKLLVVKKIIDLCAIIHDPPEMSQIEVFFRTIGMESSCPLKISDETKAFEGYLPVLSDALNANLVDYYIAKILLDDLLDIEGQSFTDKQIWVFEVIKSINFGKLLGAAINQDDTIEKLALLPRFPKYWAYMHEIMKAANKGRKEFLTVPDIEDLIKSLKKNKKVGVKKALETDGHGYFILAPNIDASLKLPPVSKMMEPDYTHESIKILNPITGAIDEI